MEKGKEGQLSHVLALAQESGSSVSHQRTEVFAALHPPALGWREQKCPLSTWLDEVGPGTQGQIAEEVPSRDLQQQTPKKQGMGPVSVTHGIQPQVFMRRLQGQF